MRSELLGVLLAVAVPLHAQTVRVANYGALPSTGWIRTTVDRLPPHPSGRVGTAEWVVGRSIGVSTWAVDVRTEVAPGQQLSIDLTAGKPMPWSLGALPRDPIGFFGGWPSVSGHVMDLSGLDIDGTAAALHFRVRLPGLWHVDLWASWRPDEPGVMPFEAVVTASNPSVPDVVAVAPASGLQLAWGDGLIHLAGAGWNAPLVPPAQAFATGQARGVHGVLIWPRHLKTIEAWLPALTAVTGTTVAVGLQRLLPDGNPVVVGSAKAWVEALYLESRRRLHTFEAALIGPSRESGDSGAQEDQVFVRGEALQPNGVGAEQVAYAAALKILARPCHHLQLDGRPVDPTTAAPRLLYWYGVPHYSEAVSPNRLGKPRLATGEECHGWGGPDPEHWLCNTTAAAARLTGSRALQLELEHQAMVYLGTHTVTPGWGNTDLFAARAVGWEGLAVVHLHRGLEDRVLAERVRSRWLARADLTLTFRQGWIDMTRDQWDVRVNDPRLGPGAWWIPWQQSVGAYGLDLAGVVLGRSDVRVLALRGAQVVLRDAWVKVGSRWQSRAQMAVAGGGPSDESFNYFGMSLAVAVVLRHQPGDEQARSIWAQLVATPERGASWLAPGVPQ